MAHFQNLELTWVERENQSRLQPVLRLFPSSGDHPQMEMPFQSQEARLKPCKAPRCGCYVLQVDFQTPASSGKYWLDLDTKALIDSPELEGDPEFQRINEALRKDLTDADHERLDDWFIAEKNEIIETTPINKIDIEDLPGTEEGKMVAFNEVFPFGWWPKFTLENELWTVDIQYCVAPKCKCSAPLFDFIKLKNESNEPVTSLRVPKAIYYNYKTKNFRPASENSTDGPSFKSLLAALREAHPLLDLRVAKHHGILVNLYTRMRLEGMKLLAEDVTSVSAPKVGRNEPCPCGSGKKYKQCCLK